MKDEEKKCTIGTYHTIFAPWMLKEKPQHSKMTSNAYDHYK